MSTIRAWQIAGVWYYDEEEAMQAAYLSTLPSVMDHPEWWSRLPPQLVADAKALAEPPEQEPAK